MEKRPVLKSPTRAPNVADATNAGEAAKPLRFCFEGDYCAPTSSGRCLRELLLASRGLEMPVSLNLLRRYGSSDEYPLPEFLKTLAERPPSGKARVFCLPAFALPERSEFGGLYLAVSGFDHRHPTPRELELLQAPRIVWVPSAAHRACLLARGFSESVVRVLEPTVNSKIFHPRASWPQGLEKPEGFRFLFVGNPLRRKGVDLVLMAYLQEFKPREKVTLVIKLSHLPKLKKQFPYEISDLGKRLGAINSLFPRVQVVAEFLPDDELAGLMAGCQAFVSTNRAYHTALSVREAMACGLPVIGPQALEDILGHTEKTGFVIPATKTPIAADVLFPEAPATEIDEISIGHLRAAMRSAFQNPDGLAKLGKAAHQQALTWGEWKTKAESIRAATDSVPPRPRRSSS